MIALGVVFSSYASEVFLSAFRAIPRGQYEGGYAIGLSSGQTMRLVILPQLIRIALPGLANLWLILLKDTRWFRPSALPTCCGSRRRRARHQAGIPVLRRRLPDLSRAGDHLVLRHQRHRARRRPAGGTAMSAGSRRRSTSSGRRRSRAAGRASASSAMCWSGLWMLLGIGLVVYPGRAWNPDFFASYAPAYLSGLGVTLIAGRHLDRARRHPVGADRLCAHVEEPDPVGACLRLCLFLPRHAAARADLPDLLRRSARSGRSSKRSASGGSSATPGIARLRLLAEHRRLSGRNPARRDRERAARASGKVRPRSACTNCRPCARSSCRRR